MKLEDIRLGQILTVSHIPEYILSNDGISKILCKKEFDYTYILHYIGKIGTVCAMCSYPHDITGVQSPRVDLKFNNKQYKMFPPEALSLAPQHFPVNNDVQVGDFVQIFGSDNVYKILDIFGNTIRSQCIKYSRITQFDITCIKSSIRPAPKKDQLTIGAACVTTPDAVDMNHDPIPNKLGRIEHMSRFDNSIIIRWPNKQFSWINRKYVIQL